jgi:hypothetical protein
MHAAYLAQAFGTVMEFALFRGGILALFALRVGASNTHLGALSALTQGLRGARYVAVPWLLRSGKHRWMAVFLPLVAVASLGWLLVEPTFHAWGSGVAVALLLAVTGLTMGLREIGFAAWHPLLNDILPQRMVGAFFGKLRTIFRVSNLVLVLALSAFMGEQPAGWKFLAVFALVSCAQFARAYFMGRIPDPVGARPSGVGLGSLRERLENLRTPFGDPGFLYSCLVQLVLVLLMSASQTLYVPFLKLSRGFHLL